MKSIKDVAPPDSLNEAELAEFKVLQRSLASLEEQWLDLHDGQNPDQVRYSAIFNREFEIRIKQAELIEEMDVEAVEKQFREECERIEREFEENQKNLFKRIVRGYYLSYQKILDHLRDLMGPDFEAFQALNEIEFPQIPSAKNQERKVPQPEEPKISYSPHETEKQLRRFKQSLNELSIPPSEVESDDSE